MHTPSPVAISEKCSVTKTTAYFGPQRTAPKHPFRTHRPSEMPIFAVPKIGKPKGPSSLFSSLILFFSSSLYLFFSFSLLLFIYFSSSSLLLFISFSSSSLYLFFLFFSSSLLLFSLPLSSLALLSCWLTLQQEVPLSEKSTGMRRLQKNARKRGTFLGKHRQSFPLETTSCFEIG